MNSPDDLSFLDDIGEEYLLQEMLQNPLNVEGAFFLFNNGEPVSYYGHKRLRTYPVKAGVTVYSKISYNNVIEKAGINLLKKLNWHGLAMVEFLFDPKSGE